MMIPQLFSFISEEWLSPAITIVVKSSVLLLLASIACGYLRHRSAALRHRLWTFTLAGCIAVPAVAMIGPQLRIPLLRANPIDQEFETALASKANSTEGCNIESGVAGTRPKSVAGDSNAALLSVSNAAFSCPVAESSVSGGASTETIDNSAGVTDVGWQQWLMAIWIVGFVYLIIRLCIAILLQHRRMGEMNFIDDVAWTSSVATIAKQLGVTRSYSTFQSATATVPMTYGVFRAVIVVPTDWPKWSDEHRHCVLSHELAHVQRYDVATQMFARIIAAVYWFNPLIWFAVYRMRVEREFACDDAVLLSGRRPSDYADALLSTLRNYRRPRFDVGVAMADSARLDRRVEAILDNTRRRHSPGRVMSCFLIAMTVCCVSMIGAAKLTAVVIQPQQASINAGQIDSSTTVVSKSVRIRGMVIGPDEQKITGAELYLNVNEYQDSIKLGKSDSEGAFQFEVPHETLKRLVSPGVFLGQCQVSLVAVADGYGAAWDFLPSEKGGRFGDMKAEYEVRLQMVEDLPIKGRIVDDAGKAVVGAVVSVDSIHELRGKTWYKMLPAIEALDVNSIPPQEIDVNNWSSYQYPGALGFVRATTDESGYYTIAGLGSNRAVRLKVSGLGIKTPPTFAIIVRKDADKFAHLVREKYLGVRLFGIDPEITVQRARTVAGTVRDAVTGEPVEIAEVYVLGGNLKYTSRQDSVWTDRLGRYRLVRSDRQAEFTIVVDGDRHLYLPTSQTFKNGTEEGEITADFAIPHGVQIRGRVVEANSDRPIAAEHRNFCDDVQPGPLYAGYAKYYPLNDNRWLNDLGEGLVSIPFQYSQENFMRWVHIDAKGEFHMSVPPGRGIILIEAHPPRDEWMSLVSGSVPRVPYLTIGGVITGTKSMWSDPKPSQTNFPGMLKPIEADDFHTYKLIDPANDSVPLDLHFEVKSPPTQRIHFVDPEGNPVSGVKVAGLMPRGANGQFQVTSVLDSDAVAYLELQNATPRRIVAISDDGKSGVSTSITAITESPLTIKMQPTASLKFRLVDKTTGKPPVGYLFSLIYGKGVASTVGFDSTEKFNRDRSIDYTTEDKPTITFDSTEKFTRDKNGEITITSIIPGEPVSLTLIPPEALRIKPQELDPMTLAPGEVKDLGNMEVE